MGYQSSFNKWKHQNSDLIDEFRKEAEKNPGPSIQQIQADKGGGGAGTNPTSPLLPVEEMTEPEKEQITNVDDKPVSPLPLTNGYISPEVQALTESAMQREQIRKEREGDLAAGRKRGEEIFGEGALGRVGTETSAEMQDILARRKAMLGGYTPEEREAQKAIYTTPAQQALQGQVRAMRGANAAAGVRGGAAASQEAQMRGRFAKDQAQLGQAQFLADVDARRQALTGYQQAVQGSEADRLQREQYNIDQKNKELMGILTTELGQGQLGVADRYNLSMGQAAAKFGFGS